MLQSLAAFKENTTSAIGNAGLQRGLARAKPHFAKKRQAAIDLLRAEQTLELGAHGPRRLHILILNGQG
ncbi:hypothetical protein [Acidocella sp.]|uniref:hypothetical protein n=1 Tax=Acidocella sp. TaxID=50710 RepID=UPI002626AB16|nr:hypothetical protein [Acidocella sp.]MDD2794875.1 hypothetical protein [Acidocella sp.]